MVMELDNQQKNIASTHRERRKKKNKKESFCVTFNGGWLDEED